MGALSDWQNKTGCMDFWRSLGITTDAASLCDYFQVTAPRCYWQFVEIDNKTYGYAYSRIQSYSEN